MGAQGMGHDAAAADGAATTAARTAARTAATTSAAAATSAADAAAVPAAPSPFEVYVHVPFCLRRCGYCDFNTYTSPDLGEGASRGNYARMAIREMQIVRDWQEERGLDEPPAGSVFFGGGTPTILPADDLVEMLDAVRRIWGLEPDAEITTEANPDTVDADYVRRLADGGFTRISFGMQSAVPAVLRTLDRRHTPANVEAGVRAADACGLRSSVDLIYGAPGESLDDWRTSVRAAVDLGVNHVSAYALTIAPRTAMDAASPREPCPGRATMTRRRNTRSPTSCSRPPGWNGTRSATGRAPATSRGTTSATGATWTGPASAPAPTPTTASRGAVPRTMQGM